MFQDFSGLSLLKVIFNNITQVKGALINSTTYFFLQQQLEFLFIIITFYKRLICKEMY